MPSAGLSISPEIVAKYAEVKSSRHSTIDWMTMKVKGESKVILDDYFPKEEKDIEEFKADKKNNTREENFLTRVWPGFVNYMKLCGSTVGLDGKKKKPACRYAVLAAFFEHEDRLQDKLLFFSWVPTGAKIRTKMIFSSTKASLTQKLEGIQATYNFTDAAEWDNWDEILATATRK